MATVRLDDSVNVEDLALELGATVEYPGGRRFNAAGTKAVRAQPKPAPAPAAAPAPAPAVPDKTMAMMQQLLQQMAVALNRPVNVTVPDMPVPQVTVQSATPKAVSWSFEFERNPNGTIKRINATPSKE